MKILFYETREIEYNYLIERMNNQLEPYFFDYSLNSYNCYVDEKYKDAQAISVFVSSELNESILKEFPNLKYIFLRCAGYSNVDIEYCEKNNIKVLNAPNYGSSTVAEFAFALILSLYKKIVLTNKQVLNGDIEESFLIGHELYNKTLGVIGVGSIGRKIINIAHGFNMEVFAYDKFQKGGYNFVEFDELLKNSDVIVLSCPLTDETKGIINKYTLSLMKKNSIIINVARGEIINTEDLYTALVNRKIAGAALDVFECEEMLCEAYEKCQKFENLREYCLKKYFFIQKLAKLENVIMTPHNAYNTYEANERILNITLENIAEVLQDYENLKNLVAN